MSLMDQSSERILALAEQLADGEEVDWDQVGEMIDPVLVGCLREVQTLGARTPPAAVQAVPFLAVGSRFAGLEIMERLSVGASAVVYRARDPMLHRDVALKLCFAPGDATMLLREGRRLVRVDHPNVLRVLGAATEGGLTGFWSDLISGETLEHWTAAKPRPSAAEVSLVGIELCSALAAVHQTGVIHGDVKPANIVRHESGRWVLLDFGSSTCSRESAATGTPRYIAPEVLGGAEPGVASDIYALGVLLFRLASGTFPVDVDCFEQLVRRHRDGERRLLLDLRPDFPLSMIDAIEAAISPAPQARPRSMGELARLLSPALPREPVVVVPATASRVVGTLLAALAAVTTLLLIALP